MTSLIGRKARSGRELQAARAMSLGRALRLTAAKQADRMMGLALNTLGVTRTAATAEALPDLLNAQSLILLMDGPEYQVCAAVLDAGLVSGLIQQQTMGKVTPISGARPHTETDAALCAPFVEALMGNAAAMPEESADRELLHGYRFGVRAQEPRVALLALDKLDYEVVCMTLDLAGGVRSGTLTLILPRPVIPAVSEPQTAENDGETSPRQPQTLSKTVLLLKTELTVALARLSLPLQTVSDFKAGDVVDLNMSSLAQALVIDVGGKVVSRATLGQLDGMRAVQLEHDKAATTQPRRRASDREHLELPDVTAKVVAPVVEDRVPAEAAGHREKESVDIFGDADAMPDMSDVDVAEVSAEGSAESGMSEGEDRRRQPAW